VAIHLFALTCARSPGAAAERARQEAQ